MLAPSTIIKKTARTALSGSYLQAVAISCLFIFICFAGMLLSSVGSIFAGNIGYFLIMAIFAVFAFCPLFFGLLYFFRRLLWGEKDDVLVLFKFFQSAKEYKRALGLTLILTVKLTSAALTVFLPCIIVWILSSERFYSAFDLSFPVWTSSLWTLNNFLAIIASFVLCFVMLKYYLAPFLLISDEDMHPAEAVNMSAIISKSTGADFVGLAVSFWWCILASLLVAPLVFTVPYFVTSYGVHCRFAITSYNRSVDRFNQKETPHYTTEQL